MLPIQIYLHKHGLQKTIKDFNLKSNDYGTYVNLKYQMYDFKTGKQADWSKKELYDCRGIIVEKGTWNVISYPLRKFFNANEHWVDDVDYGNASYFNKADGSFIHLYHWNGYWNVGTTGTAHGEGPVQYSSMTFAELFWNAWEVVGGDLDMLDTDNIYMFELMTPENEVVLEYDDYNLELLAVRHRPTLQEYQWKDIEEMSVLIGVPTVKRYELGKMSKEELFDFISTMTDQEGLVSCDGNFNRSKFKCEWYVAMHRNNTKEEKPHDIVTYMKLGNDEFEEWRSVQRRDTTNAELAHLNYQLWIEQMTECFNYFMQHLPKNQTGDERKKFARTLQSYLKDIPIFHGSIVTMMSYSDVFYRIRDGHIRSLEDLNSHIFNKISNKKIYDHISED